MYKVRYAFNCDIIKKHYMCPNMFFLSKDYFLHYLIIAKLILLMISCLIRISISELYREMNELDIEENVELYSIYPPPLRAPSII